MEGAILYDQASEREEERERGYNLFPFECQLPAGKFESLCSLCTAHLLCN